MEYIWKYKTPEGFDDLVMSGDGEALTGLWFAGSRDAVRRGEAVELRETPVFRETCRWLDEYFAGREPDFTPPLRIDDGETQFRRDVLDELKKIPFGATLAGRLLLALRAMGSGAAVILFTHTNQLHISKGIIWNTPGLTSHAYGICLTSKTFFAHTTST